MKRTALKIVGILALVTALVCVGFIVWAVWIPEPMPEAMTAAISDHQVIVSESNGDLIFRPVGMDARTAFIFYPGARVAPRSYSYFARKVAESGFTVIVPRMTLNLAIFSPSRGSEFIYSDPNIEKWAIGGHSMGGAVAAKFANENPDKIKGLVLIGSYPLPGLGLRSTEIDVVSIYGTRDGIATPDEVLAAADELPESTKWLAIDGGNHANFGFYGEQSGDLTATIAASQQQDLAAAAVVGLLTGL